MSINSNQNGKDRIRETAQDLLSKAGVKIDGPNPWDIKVKDGRFYRRVLSQGSIGLGESYMDGWWDCEKLDEFFFRVLDSHIDKNIKKNKSLLFAALAAKIFNMQPARKSFQIGKKHYDLGNDLFENMLDKRLVYSCAYWKDAATLDRAQENKLDLICKKLGLQPGMSLLDIGCGWGSLASYAAEKYQARVTGITVSTQQANYGKYICRDLPVEIKYTDYRNIEGKYDRVVSVGMIEHVGYKNYRSYMQIVHQCLKNDGLFLLQTIGSNTSVVSTDPWINKYIFPNGMLPSISQLGKAVEGLFVVEDWHNFGADYDRTLMAWYHNFTNNWRYLSLNYNQRFFRMWKYYLLSCAGSFRARRNQLWQVVFSKKGVPGGYISPR